MATLRKTDVPSQGRDSTIYLNLQQKGDRSLPVFQELSAGGFTGLVSILGVTSGDSFILVVGGVTHTVIATSTDTVRSIATKLVAAIDAGTSGANACNLRQITGGWAFNIVRATTFTLASTGSTVPANITVSTISGAGTGAAKGATSIALPFALIGRIAAGQYLRFADLSGTTEVTVGVASDAAVGATSLIVEPLDEAIPAASVAQFPPEFTHRDTATISPKYQFQGFQTLNTGGWEDGVIVGGSGDTDLGGTFFELDPATRTILKNIGAGREFCQTIDYPSPKAGWAGRRVQSIVVLEEAEKPIDVKGFVQFNVKGRAVTEPTEIPAVPL